MSSKTRYYLNVITALELIFATISKRVEYIENVLDISSADRSPDEIVFEIASGLLKTDFDRAIVHSTSWRFEKPDTIILTYFVYLDDLDFGLLDCSKPKVLEFSELELAKSKTLQLPAPEFIQVKHVVSHAVRHLAFLVKSEPNFYGERLSAKTKKALAKINKGLAGEVGR